MKSAIEREYRRWTEAFKRRDVQACLEILTPDFVWNMPDGQSLNKESVQAALKEQMDSFAAIDEFTVEIVILSSESHQATVAVNEALKGDIVEDDGTTCAIVCKETYRDSWIETTQGWRLHRSELLTTETLSAFALTLPLSSRRT